MLQITEPFIVQFSLALCFHFTSSNILLALLFSGRDAGGGSETWLLIHTKRVYIMCILLLRFLDAGDKKIILASILQI